MSKRLFVNPVVLLLLAAVPARADDAKPAKVRVLLLGDSTVIGTACRQLRPQADHLEDVVRKLLAAETDLPPVEVVNRGVNGDMIHLMMVRRYEKDVAKQPPFDFIFIRYGLNDVRHLANFQVEFPANYRKLIARLRADHPRAEIVLETVIPYLGADKDRMINEQVHAVAQAEKLLLVDQYTPYAAALKNGPNMLSYRRLALPAIPKKYHALIPPDAIKGEVVYVLDNLLDVHLAEVPDWFKDRHPNLAGYQIIGKELAGYLAPRLRDKHGPAN
jgi:lysophospholipase L1-like esterase